MKNLLDDLNTEFALETISTIDSALKFIKSTFFAVRLERLPKALWSREVGFLVSNSKSF